MNLFDHRCQLRGEVNLRSCYFLAAGTVGGLDWGFATVITCPSAGLAALGAGMLSFVLNKVLPSAV
jgi:hypothetical protein